MRTSFLVVPLLLIANPVAAADPRPAGNMPVVAPGGPKKANCPATTSYPALKKGKPAAAQKLNTLPPANHYKSVYRKIDGCEVPVVAGYGIGAMGDSKPPRR